MRREASLQLISRALAGQNGANGAIRLRRCIGLGHCNGKAMTDRTVAPGARRGRSGARKSDRAEQQRLILELRRALRLLQQSNNQRTNPEDDDEDPSRRARARR